MSTFGVSLSCLSFAPLRATGLPIKSLPAKAQRRKESFVESLYVLCNTAQLATFAHGLIIFKFPNLEALKGD
jgi:hypothetical protein